MSSGLPLETSSPGKYKAKKKSEEVNVDVASNML